MKAANSHKKAFSDALMIMIHEIKVVVSRIFSG